MIRRLKYLLALWFFSIFMLGHTTLLISEAIGGNAPKKRALLIGINYVDSPLTLEMDDQGKSLKPLRGCINDVIQMQKMLISRYGFDASEIKILTEKEATHKNILDAFQSWLIDGTQAGDVVVFHYSGHGTHVFDQSGDEAGTPEKKDHPNFQRWDEAIVPYDVSLSHFFERVILDDELGALLKRLEGRSVTVFLDCCYSGTGTKGVLATQDRYVLNPEFRTKEAKSNEPPSMPQHKGGGFSSLKPKETTAFNNTVIFSASDFYQTAKDCKFDEGYYGGFTYSLLAAMQQQEDRDGDGIFTYRDLFETTVRWMKERFSLSQNPQMEGNKKDLAQALFSLIPVAVVHPPDQPQIPPSQPQESSPSASTQPTSVLKPPSEDVVAASFFEPMATLNVAVNVLGEIDLGDVKKELSKLSFITLVSEEEMDRLITLEKRRDGSYIASMLYTSDKMVYSQNVGTLVELLKIVANDLEREFIVEQLVRLNPPRSKFRVKLWIDAPGKRRFSSTDKVTVKFEVSGLKPEQPVYVTLLNVAPDGSLTILFPQGNPQSPIPQLSLNNRVIPGKTYTIPQSKSDISEGEVIVKTIQIHLAKGEEFFKIIATTDKIDLADLNLNRFQSTFLGGGSQELSQAHTFSQSLAKTVKNDKMLWTSDELRVDVE